MLTLPLPLALSTSALSSHLNTITPALLHLKNTYCAICQGQSTANVANIIFSCPLLASTSHPLTDLGKSQASTAGAALFSLLPTPPALESLALYSSNFTRARETKEIVAEELQP